MTDTTVANAIITQLGGSGRLRAMLNAKQFVALSCGYGVRFKFSNPKRSLPNYIEIRLNGKDLYDVSFGRTVKYDVKPLSESKDVYASGLRDLFERTTEMYLSL